MAGAQCLAIQTFRWKQVSKYCSEEVQLVLLAAAQCTKCTLHTDSHDASVLMRVITHFTYAVKYIYLKIRHICTLPSWWCFTLRVPLLLIIAACMTTAMTHSSWRCLAVYLAWWPADQSHLSWPV